MGASYTDGIHPQSGWAQVRSSINQGFLDKALSPADLGRTISIQKRNPAYYPVFGECPF
jgi:hypothetical protein